MTSLHPIDWEILNAAADDCENLEQIYLAVCFEFQANGGDGAGAFRPLRGAAPLAEIAERLRGLAAGGLLTSVADDGRPVDSGDDGFVYKAWFAMTPEGRRLWAAAIPAASVERK